MAEGGGLENCADVFRLPIGEVRQLYLVALSLSELHALELFSLSVLERTGVDGNGR